MLCYLNNQIPQIPMNTCVFSNVPKFTQKSLWEWSLPSWIGRNLLPMPYISQDKSDKMRESPTYWGRRGLPIWWQSPTKAPHILGWGDRSLLWMVHNYLKKCVATPPFFVDFNSPCKGLLFPCGPNLVEKALYLVGAVLKLIHWP